MSQAALRPATGADVEAIAAVWHAAWHDAHDAHVPAVLAGDRTLDHFRGRVPKLLDATTVAADTLGVVGFVNVHDEELDLLFVNARGRGSGIGAALLDRGEEQIATRFETAWLEVVTGNDRARRFYARHGWTDAGPGDSLTDTSAGPVVVPYHRYSKLVRTRRMTVDG